MTIFLNNQLILLFLMVIFQVMVLFHLIVMLLKFKHLYYLPNLQLVFLSQPYQPLFLKQIMQVLVKLFPIFLQQFLHLIHYLFLHHHLLHHLLLFQLLPHILIIKSFLLLPLLLMYDYLISILNII